MADLLSNQQPETLRLTATVKIDGKWYGPGCVVDAVPALAAKLKGANQAESHKPKGKAPKAVKPDLKDAAVRAAVVAAMLALPKDDAHFTKGGAPEIKAVVDAVAETLPGLDLTAADRDAIWAEAQASAGGGKK